jgi:hypothetical protein
MFTSVAANYAETKQDVSFFPYPPSILFASLMIAGMLPYLKIVPYFLAFDTCTEFELLIDA